MLHFYTYLTSMLADRQEKGATATEYALIVAGIALVVLVAVNAFGTVLSGWFAGLGDQLTGA